MLATLRVTVHYIDTYTLEIHLAMWFYCIYTFTKKFWLHIIHLTWGHNIYFYLIMLRLQLLQLHCLIQRIKRSCLLTSYATYPENIVHQIHAKTNDKRSWKVYFGTSNKNRPQRSILKRYI